MMSSFAVSSTSISYNSKSVVISIIGAKVALWGECKFSSRIPFSNWASQTS